MIQDRTALLPITEGISVQLKILRGIADQFKLLVKNYFKAKHKPPLKTHWKLTINLLIVWLLTEIIFLNLEH